jgi:predicted glycoside hydrolase/deacetylase ChbG (UPF0249 family)
VDQKPVLNPGRIPSLVDENGRFHVAYGTFLRRLVLGRIRLPEVQQELEAQISLVLDHGLNITHLDSHQHLHLLPGISGVIAQIGKRTGIKRVRIPAEVVVPGCESSSRLRQIQGRLIYRLAQSRRRMFRRAGFTSPDHFFGFDCGGRFRLDNWIKLIPQLPEGVSEVMVHPGDNTAALEEMTRWGYLWEEELAALTDPRVRELLDKYKVQLINFGDLV